MARWKKHTPEQIVSLLRQIEVAVTNGKTTPAACRESGITEQTYYRLFSRPYFFAGGFTPPTIMVLSVFEYLPKLREPL